MSKSLGNVTSPIHLTNEHGGDALRVAMFFAAPPDREILWTGKHVPGAVRFLQRVYRLVRDNEERLRAFGGKVPAPGTMNPEEAALYRGLHRTLWKVARDLDSFRQNTAVSALMEYLNDLTAWKDNGNPVFLHAVREFVRALAPLAPHLGEELWEGIGGTGSVFRSGWLTWDAEAVKGEIATVVVQIDGKLRAQLELVRGADRETAEAAARQDERVSRALAGRTVARIVHVPDRLLNFVLTKG
jgi:leucyl-tRNA synthetase